MNKKITVFMPVYNSEKYLKQAIESILTQTYRNFEFLIINDGSTDSSLSIIESYSDERIRLINNSINRGLPYTRAKGLKLAKGEFIALMDSDDIAYKDRLEKELYYLENNKEVVMVSSLTDLLIDNKIIKNRSFIKGKNIVDENIMLDIQLMFWNTFSNPTCMFRKDFIVKNDIKYREECVVAQDYAFWVDCKSKGLFHIIPEALLAYRTGHENITKNYNTYKGKIRKEIIDNIRIRALNNNGFYLNCEEEKVYNTVFSDPKIDIKFDNYKKVSIILKKLINYNRINNIKDPKIFNKVVKSSYIKQVIDSNLSIYQKIKLLVTGYKIVTIKFLGNKIIGRIRALYLKTLNKI